MSDKKIIAVTGATGAQGGGLVRAILADKDGPFAARAITRNPDSDQAKALAAAGAEVVRADIDDVASLTKAFEGAHGAFCLTNFWEHMSPEKETQQARNLADAAKQAGVQHAVWSTFADTRALVPVDDDRLPTLQGKYKVPHFDSKGEANSYFIENGPPTTLMYTSFYWDNFIYFGMGPKKGEDGKLHLNLPLADKKLPGIAAEDIGKCAYGIFKEGSGNARQIIGVAGGHHSGAELAGAMGKALGQEVGYNAVPFDVFRGLGFPGAEDLGNMFQYQHDFQEEFLGDRDLDRARQLNPEMLTLEAWLAKYAGQIPLE